MDAWEIGILLEGVLEREKIKTGIATLMEEKEGMEIRERARNLKEKAQMCLESSGSSHQAVDKLVNHSLSLCSSLVPLWLWCMTQHSYIQKILLCIWFLMNKSFTKFVFSFFVCVCPLYGLVLLDMWSGAC